MNDNDICSVISYELYRSQKAYFEYITCDLANHIVSSNVELLKYMSYSDFIVHLYNYFEGCCYRELGTEELKKKTKNLSTDEILDSLLKKDFNNALLCYKEDVTKYPLIDLFVEDFRKMRNKLSHPSPKRLETNKLSKFIKNYSKYIELYRVYALNGIFRRCLIDVPNDKNNFKL